MCGGSASIAKALFSMARRNVLVVGTRSARSAFENRKHRCHATFFSVLTSPRIKRVKVQRSFDPEVVRSVEAKLKTLQVGDE